MAVLDATTTWQSGGTLAAQEIWQCQSGILRLATGSQPSAADDGIVLAEGAGVLLSSGLEVWYRKGGPSPVRLTRTPV